MAMMAMTRWRSGAMAVVLSALLLALLSAVNSLPADADAKAGGLPTDLARIPSDGLLVCSIRVADLWSGDFLATVRKKHKEIALDKMQWEWSKVG